MTTRVPSTPALDVLCRRGADLQSVRKAIAELAAAGRLPELARDIGALAKSVGGGDTRFVQGPTGPVLSLAKALGGNVTPPSRAEALAKAARYEQKAGQVTDLALAASYSELAQEFRAAAGSGTRAEARAAELERKAATVADPVQRENYELLAKQARAGAA